MNNEEFISFFAEQFDETPEDAFAETTEFKQLEEWDSMVALMVIAMIDEEYNVKINGEDIRSATTIADLISTVTAKQ